MHTFILTVAESFFGSLKNELVEHEDYRTKAEAKQSLFQYIEVFYNRQRRHSYLGYVGPAEFERASAHWFSCPLNCGNLRHLLYG